MNKWIAIAAVALIASTASFLWLQSSKAAAQRAEAEANQRAMETLIDIETRKAQRQAISECAEDLQAWNSGKSAEVILKYAPHGQQRITDCRAIIAGQPPQP